MCRTSVNLLSGGVSNGHRPSYGRNWVTERSGGVLLWRVDDLDAVSECDACNDFRQLVLALQPPPRLRRRHDELSHDEFEHNQAGGVLRQRASDPDSAVSD